MIKEKINNLYIKLGRVLCFFNIHNYLTDIKQYGKYTEFCGYFKCSRCSKIKHWREFEK